MVGSGRGGFHQQAGVWTTPYGPNIRYTVRIHVSGDFTGNGSVRARPREVDIRVVTPLGEHSATVFAARWLSGEDPSAHFDRVDLISTEEDFVAHDDDAWDDAAIAR